jgi:hypothetical protein
MNCHKSGGSASGFRWTVAGTLYTTASGGTAVSGATIRVTDANNQVIDLVTASNGNFYTLTSVVLPLHPVASKCPNTATMSSAASSGSCNSCHGSGARVHLP